MDAFLDRPLAEVLEELPLTQEIKQTLLGEDNRFVQFLIWCWLMKKQTGLK